MKHDTFMEMAFVLSKESKCCSHKVCALFVRDGRIISTGINGSVSGQKNCCDHAKEMNWVGQEIPLPEIISFEYKNMKNETKFFHWTPNGQNQVPNGTTHIINSKNWDVLKFIKSHSGNVYLWTGNTKWQPTRLTLDQMKNIVWTNENFGKRQYSFINGTKLRPKFREDHHTWSNEHEIHAEMNGLIFAAKHGVSVDGSIMYVTHSPCVLCVKALAQSGIKMVVYSELYDKNPPNWEKILTNQGIEVLQVKR